ncbi:hypothetical protein QAD02_002361 [Eretmocerus hayati]|uniref:Uncharacterized protein n=1 Tax=Eretmocerus hayati TaxID=131215 RepID=A0ACC2NJ43_9HYME|nr:hypothetical protein QAD02_002361 [Eretmocerus hayati]
MQPLSATSFKVLVTVIAAKLSSPVVGSSQNKTLGSVKSCEYEIDLDEYMKDVVAGGYVEMLREDPWEKHTCNSDRDVLCHIRGEFDSRKNRRSITKDNRISYKGCYRFAMSVTAWSPDSLCSKCHVMLFQYCEFGGRDSLRIAPPALWRKPPIREDCYSCMTDVQGISAKTKCRNKYATVPTMTVPVLSPNLRQEAPILIVSDVKSGSGKVSQSQDKEGVETDEAESVGHGIEEDRVEQEAEVQDDASDETSANETSAEEDSEE